MGGKFNDTSLLVDKMMSKVLFKIFVDYCIDYLKLDKKPKIITIYDENVAINNKSFGYFDPSNNTIGVVFANRSLADSFRTLSHELCHYKQNIEGRITNAANDGSTGSEIENEANSTSGIIMRNFGKKYPIIFKLKA